MKRNPIVHFEIPVDDVERGIDFYTSIFDWDIEKMEMPTDSSTNGEPYYAVRTKDTDEKKEANAKGY